MVHPRQRVREPDGRGLPPRAHRRHPQAPHATGPVHAPVGNLDRVRVAHPDACRLVRAQHHPERLVVAVGVLAPPVPSVWPKAIRLLNREPGSPRSA